MNKDSTLDRFLEESESSAESNNSELDPKVLTGVFDGWKKTPLAEVADDRENSFVDGPFGANLLSEEYYDEGFARTIKLQNIRSGRFINTNKKYITEEKFEELERHSAYPTEIAIAKMAKPVARACILPDFENQYILAAADVVKLDTGNGFSNMFIMYSLNSYPVWKQAYSRARGTGRKRINLNQLKEVQVPTPPLPEQRKIATVLYTVDQAIEKTEDTIQQTRRVQKGLEQHLFQKGLFNHSDIKEKRLVKLPDEWEFDQLSEHTMDSAFGPRFGSEKYNENGNIATLRTTDLDDQGHISFDTMPVADLEENEIEEHLLEPGDFIITRSGTTGIGTVWEGYDKPTIPGAFLIRFRLNDTLDPNFLKYYVNSSIGRKRVNRRAKGGVQKNLAGSDLLNMRFPIPTKEEQEEIVEVFSTIEDRIQYEQEYKSKLQRLKQGLQQDLLSGTVRTTDTNIEVPDEIAQHG
ncbi:restriction endonuclease subunit S [Halorubrum rutilum]|uniref:Restriction endonuclease subunit S n=1 Tax=Halorubrum rutilum TaxID=1364933 RepID=A0ABD6AMH1_9EURY|nr:restriction endonuclease subunit S [Halorubrum rutilum]